MMAKCSHPNIISFKEGYFFKDKYWIFMEYMDLGCLTDIIEGYYGHFTEIQLKYIAYQTLNSISYLHQNHVIHRDIKSDNLLINSAGEIKLGDFGYAAQLTRERQNRTSKVGTVCWMAPELIRGEH